MNLDHIIVGAIVVGAVVFAGIWMLRAFSKKKSGCGGNCACGKKFN